MRPASTIVLVIATESSAIDVRGVRGRLRAESQSGRASMQDTPGDSWNASTGSGSIDVSITTPAFTLDAASRSGSVRVDGATVQGVSSKRKVAGTVGLAARSSRLRVEVALSA